MRRVILKEDETQGLKDQTLKKLYDLCLKNTYKPSLMNNVEVLRKDVPGQGYIIITNDLKYQTYKTDNSKSRTGTIKPCQAFTGSKDATLGPDMTALIADLQANDKSLKKLDDEGVRANITSYKPVDLNNDPTILAIKPQSAQIFPEPNKYFLYRQVSVGGALTNVPEDIKGFMTKIKKQLDQPDVTSREYQQREPLVTVLKRNLIPLDDEMVKKVVNFKGEPLQKIWVYPLANANAAGDAGGGAGGAAAGSGDAEEDLATALESFKTAVENKLDKKLCKSAIKTLSKAQACSKGNNKGFFGTKNCQSVLNNLPTQTVENLKKYAYQCSTQGTRYLTGIFGIQDEINKLLRDGQTPYGLQSFKNSQQNQQTMNESVDDYLKNVLRKKLTVLSESKKKSVVTTKEFKHYIRTIDEAFESLNPGKKRINEDGLKDMLSGALGYGGEGIISYFKERLAKSIIDKFVPGGSDTWLGGIISTSVGNIKLGDYLNGNILKCDFVVKELAKGIGENAIKQFADKKGLTGGFYDVLRNSVVEVVEDVPFVESLEKGIATVLCPSLSKLGSMLGGLFGSLGTELKQEITPSK
jgi:hypothetical protein